MTEHVEYRPPPLRRCWALFWPLIWLIDLVAIRPMCLERDDA